MAQPLSLSLITLAAAKVSFVDAAIWIVSPFDGLRPSRAGLSCGAFGQVRLVNRAGQWAGRPAVEVRGGRAIAVTANVTKPFDVNRAISQAEAPFWATDNLHQQCRGSWAPLARSTSSGTGSP